MADPYVYAGTTVLKNRFGVRDPAALRALEYGYTMNYAARLPDCPATSAGFKAIHKHLFGQVYDWAGEVRTVDIAKGRAMFARAAFINVALDQEFRDLARRGRLLGLSAEAFAREAAHHIAEVNAIHPFREGNGRTMRAHLELLARRGGHDLRTVRIPKAEWMTASIASFEGDEAPLAQVVLRAMVSER